MVGNFAFEFGEEIIEIEVEIEGSPVGQTMSRLGGS